MKNRKTGAKILLVTVYLLFALLFVLVVFLPRGAYWYTDIKHRPESLPTVVISTCYPCVPFAVAALFALRSIAKNILNDSAISKNTLKNLFILGACCLAAGVIMMIAGFFYFPFFVSGGAVLFCALLTRVFAELLFARLGDGADGSDGEEPSPETKEDDLA